MRKHLMLAVALTLVAACGDGTGGTGTEQGTTTTAVAEATSEESTEAEAESADLEVDNCSLLTAAEVSDLAGEQLEATEDSPLGCAFVVPGEIVGEFSIRSYRGSGDSMSTAGEMIPDAEDIFPIEGVGDDAAAISTYGDVVNFIIARQGDLFVELNTTFILFEPDSPEMETAIELASIALGRLVESG